MWIVTSDDEVNIFSLYAKLVDENTALRDFFKELNVRVCYMDVSGEHSGEATLQKTDLIIVGECGPKPDPMISEISP